MNFAQLGNIRDFGSFTAAIIREIIQKFVHLNNKDGIWIYLYFRNKMSLWNTGEKIVEINKHILFIFFLYENISISHLTSSFLKMYRINISSKIEF